MVASNQNNNLKKAVRSTVKMIETANDTKKLKHPLTSNQKAGLTFDYTATRTTDDDQQQWRRINSGRRTSFTYASYLAYQSKEKLQRRLDDLGRYLRSNYGVQRLYIYMLTVNPKKVSSTYRKLKTVNKAVIATVESLPETAVINMNMENAIVYGRRHRIQNDRHLHYIMATTAPLTARFKRRSIRAILGVCRRLYGYGVTTATYTANRQDDNGRGLVGYATKGVGLFNPLKHGHDGSGQSEIEKIYTANRNSGNRAGVDVIADEINQSYNVHRQQFYVNRRNPMATSWRSSTSSFKKFIENYNDPKAKGRDASMNLFDYPKRRPKDRITSRHHATTKEVVRTFNGLNRYTGQPLQRIKRETERRNRRTLAHSRDVMDHLTSDGQKSVSGQFWPAHVNINGRRRRSRVVTVINTS